MQTSIVLYNEVKDNNKDFRIDAEFYSPKYLQYEKQINAKQNDLLRNLADNSYKSFRKKNGIFEYIEISNVDLITGEYIEEVLDANNPPSRAKKILNKNDIIISTVRPNRNAVSIILSEKKDLVASTGFCKLTPQKINPKFLFVLFKTSIYRDLLIRFTTATMYPAVNEDDILNLKIPLFDDKFQLQIDLIVDKCYSLINGSKYYYSQAEQILLSELGLLNWKPKHRLFFVKNFSDTTLAGRIDAEYFQPKYEEIIKSITSSKNHVALGDIVSIKKCIEPGSEAYQDSGIPFLRVSNLSKFGINNDNQQFISENLYDSLKTHQPKKGEILLSKDATPGIAYYLKDTPSKMIPSGGILRLSVKDTEQVMPEYLTLVLNSVIVQKQIERDAGGSIINHWLVDQVKSTLIPLLPISTQKQIAEKIDKSFSDRELSKHLLDIAKHGVEMAIEKDEATAEKWMKSELKKIDIEI